MPKYELDRLKEPKLKWWKHILA